MLLLLLLLLLMVVNRCDFLINLKYLILKLTVIFVYTNCSFQVCLVGTQTDKHSNRVDLLQGIYEVIALKKQSQEKNSQNEVNFVPRPKLEIVQNCTRLDAQVKNKVFESVVEKLLATVNCIKLKGIF